MALLDRNRAPPPHYYADRLLTMLRGVASQYSDLLSADERATIACIRALSTDAQRLLARLLSRRGTLFRIDSLGYREVVSPEGAIDSLARAGLITRAPGGAADRHLALLAIAEIVAAFPHVARRKRRELIGFVAARYPDAVIRERIAARHGLVELVDADRFRRFELLYFGEGRDLSTFVLEDLGMLRFESYPLDACDRLFADRTMLDRYLELGAMRERIGGVEQRWNAEHAADLARDIATPEASRLLARRRSALLNRLGYAAERAGDAPLALECYRRSERPPARERTVRLLARRDPCAANALLREIRASPQSANEARFARDFGRRRPRRLPCESVLRLPAPPSTHVEAAALEVLARDAVAGSHLENALPRTMLGLAFWEELFAPIAGAFSNPYQSAPLDLYWKDFRAARHAAIAARLSKLEQHGVAAAVRATFHEKHGIANALVAWGAFDDAFLAAVLDAVPNEKWCAMFDYMLDDLEQTRTGFPDLTLVYGPGRHAFVEVKGPGDELRREQKIWFDFFARAGIDARLLRVAW